MGDGQQGTPQQGVRVHPERDRACRRRRLEEDARLVPLARMDGRRPTGGQRPRLPQADHRGEGPAEGRMVETPPGNAHRRRSRPIDQPREHHLHRPVARVAGHPERLQHGRRARGPATGGGHAGVPGRARRRRHVLRGLAAHRPMDGLRPRQDRRSRDVRAGQRRGRRRLPNQLPQGPGPAGILARGQQGHRRRAQHHKRGRTHRER